jgi:hypothetical protein
MYFDVFYLIFVAKIHNYEKMGSTCYSHTKKQFFNACITNILGFDVDLEFFTQYW